jgi:steroid delta-isomerase
MSDILDSTSKSMTNLQYLHHYAIALTQLKPENVSTLGELVADDIRFSDPFNNLQGKASFIGVMDEMFEQLEDVRFDLLESQLEGHIGYLYWRFNATSSLTGGFSTEGCSRICFNEQWLVSSHQDFWDASLLMQQFPLLGRVIKGVRKKASYKV